MQKKITLRKTIAIVKLSLFVIWFLPLPLDASKRKILCMKLYQYVSILLTITVIASMVYAVMKNLHDPELVIKSSLGLFPCFHVIWNILCRVAIYQRLQYVTFKMENFCALIKTREEEIVQQNYIDKCANFYGFCISSFYMSVFALFVGPIVLDQPLPAPAEFPFDASRQPLRAITYLHQVVVGLQIAAHLSVNAFMAFLLWLASARFKLLIEDLRTIANIYDFMKCIEKHQQLLEYAKEVTLTVRPFALGTIFFSTIALIVFGLIFITGASLTLKIQCVFLAVSALLEVFMYAWPAEHLIHISNNIAQIAFETNWYDESEDFRKNLQMIILRSQKPILVILPCGLPSLSLHYYASYLSTIFSYFTTMRMMFDEQKNGA
ncbi:Odorant receptor 269 [Nylanderia fulva]|uniref:Odorant receptor n=2 Tax=Nylanderia fulva TaxID=613905 RepID=A0A6G1LQA3_9HYME|nr:Odorant receptor 269 [Nylanderia fulva]